MQREDTIHQHSQKWKGGTLFTWSAKGDLIHQSAKRDPFTWSAKDGLQSPKCNMGYFTPKVQRGCPIHQNSPKYKGRIPFTKVQRGDQFHPKWKGAPFSPELQSGDLLYLKFRWQPALLLKFKGGPKCKGGTLFTRRAKRGTPFTKIHQRRNGPH